MQESLHHTSGSSKGAVGEALQWEQAAAEAKSAVAAAKASRERAESCEMSSVR